MHRPVFIYSSWRTSSTWVWTKFRELPNTVAYNEVYHGQLSTITANDIKTVSPANWESHHPKTDSYFLEFAPLLNENGIGIRGFHPEFEYTNFIPDHKDSHLPGFEKTYLDSLIHNAHRLNKTPVLTCTRNLARVRATRVSYDGVHIVTTRNLWHQWMSYAGQGLRRNPWFLETIRAVYEASQTKDPVLSALYERHRDAMHTSSPIVADRALFHAFVALHLVLYARAFSDADLILDVNRLAHDKLYREESRRRIYELTGLTPDFSDATESIDFAQVEIPDEAELLGEIAWTQRLLTVHGYPMESGETRPAIDRLISDMIGSLRHHRAADTQITKGISRMEIRIQELESAHRLLVHAHALEKEDAHKLRREVARLQKMLYSAPPATHLYRAIKTALKDPNYTRR